MAFLDNSGDIILDAVLTDAGRQRLARGNFRITKFALGDEEMNYALYNSSHPSGSAFYDLELMQTPVLEAFTNNTSMMKTRLITMTRNNILYLPMLKLNSLAANRNVMQAASRYVILADLNTEQNSTNVDIANYNAGIMRGTTNTTWRGDDTNHIAVDQGIDTKEGGISFKTEMPSDLVETAYLVRVDHRLLTLHEIGSGLNTGRDAASGFTMGLTNQFIDDDGIATYYLALNDGTNCVEANPTTAGVARQIGDNRSRHKFHTADGNNITTAEQANEVFDGPLGTILRFYPKTSLHVQQSDSLFEELGATSDFNLTVADGYTLAAGTYKQIDTLINVTGVTTGYSIYITIRIIKKNAT